MTGIITPGNVTRYVHPSSACISIQAPSNSSRIVGQPEVILQSYKSSCQLPINAALTGKVRTSTRARSAHRRLTPAVAISPQCVLPRQRERGIGIGESKTALCLLATSGIASLEFLLFKLYSDAQHTPYRNEFQLLHPVLRLPGCTARRNTLQETAHMSTRRRL